MRNCLRLLTVLLAGIVLGGCSWLFGDDDVILSGERIAILEADQLAEPDPDLADLAISLPEPRANSAWPQPGGSSEHSMEHLALSGNLERVWRANVGTRSGHDRKILAQPIVVDGRVYTMDARVAVTAFDDESGSRIWRRNLAPDGDRSYYGGGLAYDDGRLFVTTGMGQVFALDAESGEQVWQRRAGAPLRAGPTVRDGRVFAVTSVNRTLALSAEDGRELWTHQGIEEEAAILGAPSPAASEASVIVAYSSGELFALLNDNGRMLWADSLTGATRADAIADMSDIRGMPVIYGNQVYAASNANQMVAIDARSGGLVWEKDLGSLEMAWAAGDFLFLVNNMAQVVAMERDSGRIAWVTNLRRYKDPDDRAGVIVWQGPVLAGERLFLAGSHGEVAILSPYDGEILGNMNLPDGAAVSPVVANDTIYFLTDRGRLLAYR